MKRRVFVVTVWLILPLLAISAIVAAAFSPLLAWRDPVYIVAGFAGIIALALLMFQPLLATASVPRVSEHRQKQIHKALGIALFVSVAVHVTALWITSPPDVIDALLFASPTLFTPFGVIAMWAIFATLLLFALRKRLRLPPKTWRKLHLMLVWLIVPGTVLHAMLIEGTMEIITKTVLCVIALAILSKISWGKFTRRRASG